MIALMITRAWHTVARLTIATIVLFPMWLSYAIPWFRTKKLGAKIPAAVWSKKHRKAARRFYWLAVKMRGGLIKVGQILSTRVDLLPIEWLEELAGLQDSVEATPFSKLQAHVEEGYGKSIDELFTSFEREAVAAASFGQVHRGTLMDGTEVALKIRYPKVKLQLSIDLFVFSIAVRLFNIFLPKISLQPIKIEISRALSTELDYEQEANFTRIIHDNFVGRQGVVIPRVIDELTTDDVICTTWFDGVKITGESVLNSSFDRKRLLEILLGAWVQMMYVDGVFQSDPHPGNLLVHIENGEATLGVVDFGQVKILDKEFHQKLVNSVMAFAMGNIDMFMSSLVALGLFPQEEVEALQPKVDKLLTRLREERAIHKDELDFGKLRAQFLETLDEMSGIVIPQELVLYGRTFALLAGVTRAMAPDINALAVARPLITDALLKGGPPAKPAEAARA